jgi:hypothetical protein
VSTVPAPASTAEALAMIRAGMGYLAAADPTAMAAEAQAECLQALEQLDAVETAARARILAAFTAGQTSDAVKLSSCLGKFFLGGWEGGGLVILAAGGQAVPEAAEQAAEQVALGGGVPVAVVAAPVVVGAGAG